MSSRTFVAQYGGKECPACEELIVRGQLVKFNDDDQLVHDDCEESAPPPEKPVDVCPKCHLTRPCEHDDD